MNKEELKEKIIKTELKVDALKSALDSDDIAKQHELIDNLETFANLLEEYSKL